MVLLNIGAGGAHYDLRKLRLISDLAQEQSLLLLAQRFSELVLETVAAELLNNLVYPRLIHHL